MQICQGEKLVLQIIERMILKKSSMNDLVVRIFLVTKPGRVCKNEKFEKISCICVPKEPATADFQDFWNEDM
jgi:hypothetical protein